MIKKVLLAMLVLSIIMVMPILSTATSLVAPSYIATMDKMVLQTTTGPPTVIVAMADIDAIVFIEQGGKAAPTLQQAAMTDLMVMKNTDIAAGINTVSGIRSSGLPVIQCAAASLNSRGVVQGISAMGYG